MNIIENNGRLTFVLEGRIDAANATPLDNEISDAIGKHSGDEIVFDAKKLEYISSAGLRVLLKVQKAAEKPVTISDVSRDVYDIFETTGFSQLLNVKKAMRKVSLDGCELIGKGGHGNVYRLDDETIIKVYHDNSPLSVIDRERSYAKDAFVHGVPTAMAYDTVETEEGFGVIFEMVGGVTVGRFISEHPEKLDEYARRFASLLKTLNTTEAASEMYTGTKKIYLDRLKTAGEYFTAEENVQLDKLLASIPDGSGMIHGDYHTNNVLVQADGELILIDMADISRGNGLFDIGGTYIMKWLSELYGDTPDLTVQVVGLDAEKAVKVRDITLSAYFDTEDKEKLARAENVCDAVSLLKMASLLGVIPPGSKEAAEPIVGVLRKHLFPKIQEYCDMLGDFK